MWKRKELKQQARLLLKKNFIAAVCICFIMAIIVGEFGSTTQLIHQYDDSKEVQNVVLDNSQDSNAQSAANLINTIDGKDDAIKGQVDSTASSLGLNDENGSQTITNTAANIFDSMTRSQRFIFKLVNAFNSSQQNDTIKTIIYLVMSVVSIFITVFICNILTIGESRFLLECSYFNNTKTSALLYIYRDKKILNAAKIMFFRDLQLILWYLTIIGGIIKTYEYRMIPYILSTNPNISKKKAFALSKSMMKKQKFKLFILDISYWYWYAIPMIFGVGFTLLKHPTAAQYIDLTITLLLGVFFINPYTKFTESLLYLKLRDNSIKMNMPYSSAIDCEFTQSYGYVFPHAKHEKLDYLCKYSLTLYILIFFTFSIIGWVWEVLLHLFTDGEFVNRGVMFGPWLPIYGCGGVSVLLLLRKWAKNKIVTFFLVMFVCLAIEYFTSWYLETTKGIKWWDYSGYFMNLNGRICLEGGVIFGFGGCAGIYAIGPFLNKLYNKIPKTTRITICVILTSLFTIDTVHAHKHPNIGKGITDYDTKGAVTTTESVPLQKN